MSALVKWMRIRLQLAWWIKAGKSLNYEKSTLVEANHMWRANAGERKTAKHKKWKKFTYYLSKQQGNLLE